MVKYRLFSDFGSFFCIELLNFSTVFEPNPVFLSILHRRRRCYVSTSTVVVAGGLPVVLLLMRGGDRAAQEEKEGHDEGQ